MKEPTRDARIFQKRFWNQGMERTQFNDRRRKQQLRRKWSEFLSEQKKKFNSQNRS